MSENANNSYYVEPQTTSYNVADSDIKQIKFKCTLLGVDSRNEILERELPGRYGSEFTDQTVAGYVNMSEARMRCNIDCSYITHFTGFSELLQGPYKMWAIKVTAPDGSDSRVFTSDENIQMRMCDYPRLFVDGCSIEIRTPVYHGRCPEAMFYEMDEKEYMQMQYPPWGH